LFRAAAADIFWLIGKNFVGSRIILLIMLVDKVVVFGGVCRLQRRV
jgi:hypothetical protein